MDCWLTIRSAVCNLGEGAESLLLDRLVSGPHEPLPHPGYALPRAPQPPGTITAEAPDVPAPRDCTIGQEGDGTTAAGDTISQGRCRTAAGQANTVLNTEALFE